MQTRTYGDLFKITSALIGTGGELDVSEQDQVSHFINRRFQQAFDESPVWPRYLVPSEKRSLYSLNVVNSATSAVNGNYEILGQDTSGYNVYQLVDSTSVHVFRDGTTWKIKTASTASLAGSGTYSVSGGTTRHEEQDTEKKDNPYDVIVWSNNNSGAFSVTNTSLIPFTETNKNAIGDFNRIHRKKAFMNNSSLEYEFFVDFNGANILNIANSTDTTAFVSYKKQFTPFTVTSDYYNSTAEVPGEFFNYIAHAVYADFLRVQNRQQEALAEEQVAQTYLALELEKIDIRSNNNTINKRFSTYVNRQAR